MIISKAIDVFVVNADDTIRHALTKISGNRLRGIFVVDTGGKLVGVMTDGDFRRWLLRESQTDLGQPVAVAMKENVVSARISDSSEKIRSLLSDRITMLPLVDQWRRLVAIAKRDTGTLSIGPFEIGGDAPVFVIAEIGNNHNGSMELARKLIDEAAAANVNCVKFQMRDMRSLYVEDRQKSQDLGVEYTIDLLERFNLPPEKLFELFDYSKSRGLLPLCTPWDHHSVDMLESYGVAAYKTASADLTNFDLLEKISATHKPIIISTGMSRESEIRMAVDLLRQRGAQFVLLHTNSTYPAPFEDINLRFINFLRELGDGPVGYSSHDRGIGVCLAAVGLGAKVIEKHLTLDREMEGVDHKVSLLPGELGQLVSGIREVEAALGSTRRQVSQGELLNRESLAKSLIATADIAEGAIITRDMVEVKSPGKGLQPIYRPQLIGRPAVRAMAKGEFFFESDITGEQVKARQYRFRRPWGVPVRYHDYKELIQRIRPDFLEYHLSYRDLEADLGAIFDELLPQKFVVHAPELFAGDHLLNLCSADAAYRQKSCDMMKQAVEVTEKLRASHLNDGPTLIITNVGGFSLDRPMSEYDRQKSYEWLAQSLDRLRSTEVEIIAQTMPPFPWHFGGQRFHNLFVSSRDTQNFCEASSLRLCLDVSHTQLACNLGKQSLTDFVDAIGSHVAHLHLADAKGMHGEGLQIGEGEISFASLAQHLDRVAPSAGFIPEIWQGHKNGGAGFWTALALLEDWF